MSHYLLEDLNNLYSEVSQYESTEEFNTIVEEVFGDLVYALASEGYSAKGIISYLSHTPHQEIVEYYYNIDQVHQQVSEEYVQEQVDIINEGLGAFLKVIGGGLLRSGKGLGKGLIRATKATGQNLKTATKTGFPQTSQKLSGAVTKIKDVLKSPVTKIGGAAAALGGAYALGRMQGGAGTTPKGAPPKPPTPPTPPTLPTLPKSPSDSGKTPSKEDINKEYARLRKKDPAAAEKYGLEQWKKLYPKLATKVKPDGTQRGTGESQMEKDAEELRRMSNRSKQRQGELMGGPEGPGEIDKGDVEASIKAQKERDKKRAEESTKKESYDAYDLVLDYLISEGHADTVDEANYVMMQMDSKQIQSICEMRPVPMPNYPVGNSKGPKPVPMPNYPVGNSKGPKPVPMPNYPIPSSGRKK